MKRFIVALFLLVALPMTALAADGAKVGVVDIQKVLLMSDAGKDAKDQLSQRAGKYEGEKNSKEEELKKLKEYQRFLKDAQEDLQAKNDEFTGKIVDEIVKITQAYGRQNSYTAIFVKSETMVYFDASADVTEEVLKAFNAARKK